jgi:hypothetical protein
MNVYSWYRRNWKQTIKGVFYSCIPKYKQLIFLLIPMCIGTTYTQTFSHNGTQWTKIRKYTRSFFCYEYKWIVKHCRVKMCWKQLCFNECLCEFDHQMQHQCWKSKCTITVYVPPRVTRLGEYLPIGRLFPVGSFFNYIQKNTKISDWANLRLLCDCFLWAAFLNYKQKNPQFLDCSSNVKVMY